MKHELKLAGKMHTKIMFFFLFLIITLFSSTGVLCIRNEEIENYSRAQSRQIMVVSFFPQSDERPIIESRQYYSDNTYQGNKVAFPTKHEDNVYNRNEIAQDYSNTYDSYQQQEQQPYQQTNNQRENPYDSQYNTGESFQNQNQNTNSNSYPTSNYPNTIFDTNGNGPDVPTYQTYNDPNYNQGNYAQNYNYPNNKRPNYTPRPQTSPFNRYPNQSVPPYRPQNYRPLPPPPPPPQQAGFPPQRYPPPPAYPPNYAGQFNNYRPSNNPLLNFFNNFGNQPGQIGQLGDRFTKALEDIARNDDLQCVPKLLCQMVGDPERRAQLPGFISAPAFSALIAAVPSTSPALSFGRAALLGFTGGERRCQSTYSKCPQNDDELLYYLNNHRGGFFRFFNGGGSFGDESSDQYNPSQQQSSQYQRPRPHQQQQQQQQQPSSTATLEGLQSLADTLNNGGGINLSNLGSNLGLISNLASLVSTANQNPLSSLIGGNSGGNSGTNSGGSSSGSSADTSSGVSDILGNLLTGLVGDRFTSRKITKRSLNITDEDLDENKSAKKKLTKSGTKKFNIETDIVHKKLSVQNSTKVEPVAEKTEPDEEQIEGRIVNTRNPILSDIQDGRGDELRVKFPFDNPNSVTKTRGEKTINFYDTQQYGTGLKFPSYYDDNDEYLRRGKKIHFQDDRNYAPKYATDYRKEDEELIFPDRRGTGNLRFDNEKFISDDSKDPLRSSRILFRPSYRPYDDRDDRDNRRPVSNYDDRDDRDNRRPVSNYDDRDNRRPSYYDNDDRNDRYRVTTRRPHYDDYTTTTRRPYYDSTTRRPYYDDYDRTTRRPSYNNYDRTTRRPYYDDYDRTTSRPSYSRYEQTTTRRPFYSIYDYPQTNGNYQVNRYTTTRRPTTYEPNRNVYVTNSRGVIEYYITPSGKKVYV